MKPALRTPNTRSPNWGNPWGTYDGASLVAKTWLLGSKRAKSTQTIKDYLDYMQNLLRVSL